MYLCSNVVTARYLGLLNSTNTSQNDKGTSTKTNKSKRWYKGVGLTTNILSLFILFDCTACFWITTKVTNNIAATKNSGISPNFYWL